MLEADPSLAGVIPVTLFSFPRPARSSRCAAFRPNVFIDITETIETKIRGMTMCESEARAFPHPRSAEALRTYARRYGSIVGLPYAEAHELVRAVSEVDPIV